MMIIISLVIVRVLPKYIGMVHVVNSNPYPSDSSAGAGY